MPCLGTSLWQWFICELILKPPIYLTLVYHRFFTFSTPCFFLSTGRTSFQFPLSHINFILHLILSSFPSSGFTALIECLFLCLLRNSGVHLQSQLMWLPKSHHVTIVTCPLIIIVIIIYYSYWRIIITSKTIFMQI